MGPRDRAFQSRWRCWAACVGVGVGDRGGSCAILRSQHSMSASSCRFLALAFEFFDRFVDCLGQGLGLAFGYVCDDGFGDLSDAVVFEVEQRAVILARELRLGRLQLLGERWLAFTLNRLAADLDLAALGFAPASNLFAFKLGIDAPVCELTPHRVACYL